VMQRSGWVGVMPRRPAARAARAAMPSLRGTAGSWVGLGRQPKPGPTGRRTRAPSVTLGPSAPQPVVPSSRIHPALALAIHGIRAAPQRGPAPSPDRGKTISPGTIVLPGCNRALARHTSPRTTSPDPSGTAGPPLRSRLSRSWLPPAGQRGRADGGIRFDPADKDSAAYAERLFKPVSPTPDKQARKVESLAGDQPPPTDAHPPEDSPGVDLRP
jgi:hypothetical protein